MATPYDRHDHADDRNTRYDDRYDGRYDDRYDDRHDEPHDQNNRYTRYVREERREERYDDRDPAYNDRGNYATSNNYESRELVPRSREEGDLAVSARSNRHGTRSRSADAMQYDEYGYQDRNRDRDLDRRSRFDDRDVDRKGRYDPDHGYYGELVAVEEGNDQGRMLSNTQKILSALAGAAILVGSKEAYDRYEAKQNDEDVQRSLLTSAAMGAAGLLAGYQGAEYVSKHRAEKHMKKIEAGPGADREPNGSHEDNFLTKALRSSYGKGDAKEGGFNKFHTAAKAAILAGATEAFRVAKEPGGWKGAKARRVITAAMGAGTIDAAHDKGGSSNSNIQLAESVIGGLLGNRVLNGSKKNIGAQNFSQQGRSRSKSSFGESKGVGGMLGNLGGLNGLAALATAGLGALGAKKVYDNYENKEDGRSRSRRPDSDDEDTRGGNSGRSRSVLDTARKGLAKLGLAANPDDKAFAKGKGSSRSKSRASSESRSPERERRRHNQDDFDLGERPRRSRRDADEDEYESGPRQAPRRAVRTRSVSKHSESDLGHSSEDDKRIRKLKGKQFITNALAVVATVHAAHEIWESVEKREARHKAVKEGKLSPAEAKKLKSKALLQDAATVGMAALGVKGAVSNLKEARESIHALREFREAKEERHNKRLERSLNPQSTDSSADYRDDNYNYYNRADDDYAGDYRYSANNGHIPRNSA